MTKRKKIVIGVVAAVGLLIVIGIASGGSKQSASTSSNNNNQQKNQTKTATVAKLNEPARDGKFEFTVKSVTCGKATVGANEYLKKTAQGQYCEVSLSVKNIGNEAQQFFSMNQALYNASNQKYSADDQATAYMSANGDAWINQINPGNSVDGIVVFDLPKDQTPTTAELHDSAYSSGVKVNLQ